MDRKSRLRALIITAMIMILPLVSGCGGMIHVQVSDQASAEGKAAAVKEGGGPFTICLLDEDPPIESSYLWIKGLCEELQALGYISDRVDLSAAPCDYEGYFEYVSGQDLGGCLVIDRDWSILNEENKAAAGRDLRRKAEEGRLDLIAVTGTYPGVFIKSLDLPVPLLVSYASDPVASGIIKSPEDSGDEDVWALIEPAAYARQLEIYRELAGFDKLGIMTTDVNDEIACGPEIYAKADELGIQVVKKVLSQDDMYSDRAEAVYTQAIRDLADQDVDAVLVLFGVLDGSPASPESAVPLLEEKQIPYFISDGDELVRRGGMLLISFYNYEGYGKHVADVCSRIFHGEKAGSQTIEYISSPRIVLNMDTAKRLGFDTDFRFLQTVDTIYRNGAEG